MIATYQITLFNSIKSSSSHDNALNHNTFEISGLLLRFFPDVYTSIQCAYFQVQKSTI
jgi:hypothetical protein